jgi:hypothetical protein
MKYVIKRWSLDDTTTQEIGTRKSLALLLQHPLTDEVHWWGLEEVGNIEGCW